MAHTHSPSSLAYLLCSAVSPQHRIFCVLGVLCGKHPSARTKHATPHVKPWQLPTAPRLYAGHLTRRSRLNARHFLCRPLHNHDPPPKSRDDCVRCASFRLKNLSFCAALTLLILHRAQVHDTPNYAASAAKFLPASSVTLFRRRVGEAAIELSRELCTLAVNIRRRE